MLVINSINILLPHWIGMQLPGNSMSHLTVECLFIQLQRRVFTGTCILQTYIHMHPNIHT